MNVLGKTLDEGPQHLQRLRGKREKAGVNKSRIDWEVIEEERSGVNKRKLGSEEDREVLKSRISRA